MFNIDRNTGIIVLNRGDSVTFPLFINTGTPMRPVKFSLLDNPNAAVYVGVMLPNQPFEYAVLRKKYTYKNSIDFNSDRNLMITFSPEETERLKPGMYYYEIKLQKNDNMWCLDNDITVIDDKSILKPGCMIMKGSYINGSEVIIGDSGYFDVEQETQLSTGDYIVAGSILANGTVLNSSTVKMTNVVNTLIPKTKFIIEG